jgi:hypothetical protein
MRFLIVITSLCILSIHVREAGAGGLFDGKKKGLIIDFGIGAGLSAFGYNEIVNGRKLNYATDVYSGITVISALNIGYAPNDVWALALGEQLSISKHQSKYDESALFIEGLLGPSLLINLKKEIFSPYFRVGLGFSHHTEGKGGSYYHWYGGGAHAGFGYVIKRFISIEAKLLYSLNFRDVAFFYTNDPDYGFRWMYWDTGTTLQQARQEAYRVYQHYPNVQEIVDSYILNVGHIRIGSLKVGLVFSVPIF